MFKTYMPWVALAATLFCVFLPRAHRLWALVFLGLALQGVGGLLPPDWLRVVVTLTGAALTMGTLIRQSRTLMAGERGQA